MDLILTTRSSNRRVLASVSTIALLSSFSAAVAASAEPAIDEIVVTGSRVIRDGYEAPTPVSVLGVAELQSMATANIADAVNRLPALANSLSTRGSSTADMTGGINNLNLRGLTPVRTLVLIDGKRVVGSTLAGFNNNGGAVDVNTVPSGLVSRVDIVTGGASAAYGSDALAGIVNFVFDKEYTGIKGNVQTGISTYGDNENYKAEMTAGFPFAGGRGHLLAYGEYGYEDEARKKDRPWSEVTYAIVPNPLYVVGNGQPQNIAAHDVGLLGGTPGGLIVTCNPPPGQPAYNLTTNQCPLRGTQFLEGGTPAPFVFGTLTTAQLMIGGDFRTSRIDNDTALVTELSRGNVYLRASYDLADNVNVFAEWGWSWSKNRSRDSVVQFQIGGGAPTVQSDNAFIPASVRARAVALGIPSFRVGSVLDGIPGFGNLNERVQRRYVGGVEGNFDAGSTNWTWDAYYQMSTTHASVRTPDTVVQGNLTKAIDAVLDSTGKIVCRVNIDTNPANDDPDCIPYNIMGINVNSDAAKKYITGTGYALIFLQQDVAAASASGEPFDNWAGPVSLAFGVEHRTEQVGGIASSRDQNAQYFAGNFTASSGKYSVTEGFVETVFPLAKDASFAQSLDLNASARATDYSTSGFVTTWKVGATWTPVDDIRVRATRSRDIRAPNLGDLFLAGRSGTGSITDRFNNDRVSTIVTRVGGNTSLLPEKANTLGLGVVLQPSFLPGFGASVDYFDIDIKGAIVSLGAQNYMDRCFAGETVLCSFITRDAAGVVTQIRVQPANVLLQSVRGLDLEASYRFTLADINEALDGSLAFRALGTYYDKLLTTDANGNILNGAGSTAAVGGLQAPKLKYLLSMNFSDDSFAATLSARGFTGGVINHQYVVCTSGCPLSTAVATTVGFENKTPGALYFDLNLSQKFMDDAVEAFFSVDNVVNKQPPVTIPGGYYTGVNNDDFDTVGRTFRVGARFRY